MYKFILFFMLLLCIGCTKTTVINTNQFYQEDYDYFCFDENKTFSQIIMCLNAENKAEHTQNRITNELIQEIN